MDVFAALKRRRPCGERAPGADRTDRTAKQAIVVHAVTDRDPTDRLVGGKLAVASLALHPVTIISCLETK